MAALSFGTLLSGCASKLQKESNTVVTPETLTQKIEQASDEEVLKSVEYAKKKSAQTSPPVVKATSTKKMKSKPPAPVQPPKPTGFVPQSWPYGLGEKSEWVIRWGLIEGGRITMTVEEPKLLDGIPTLNYRAHAQSSKVMDLIYKIDNQIDTFVRVSDHLPLRQEIVQNESGRWGKRVVLFDQDKNRSRFYENITKKGGEKSETLREDDITPFAQDPFTALFFFRFLPVVNRYNFPVHDRWKNWNNEAKFLGEEKVRVPAGEFETRHYQVFPRVEGSIEPKGDVEMWVWKHPSNLVVKFNAKIKVGSITGEVSKYEPGRPIPYPTPTLFTPYDLPNQ